MYIILIKIFVFCFNYNSIDYKCQAKSCINTSSCSYTTKFCFVTKPMPNNRIVISPWSDLHYGSRNNSEKIFFFLIY